MKRALLLGAGLGLLVLTGCAPAIVQPQALVSPLSEQAAYQAAVHTINVQPYPGNTDGWVITQASKTDGFVSAELSERRCHIDGFGPLAHTRCYRYRSLVTVTLISRSDGATEVDVGSNGTTEARKLAAALEAALHLQPESNGVHL